MGAWGYGYFENDSALDFIEDLEESDNPKETIRNVFEAALETDYLESDEGNAIIIAATYVDSQVNGTKFSKADRDDPLLVDTFQNRHPYIDLADLRSLAVAALQSLLGDNSDLKELWEESGEFKEWSYGIKSLIERLDK